MAGDWIRMRTELLTHPKYLSLCSRLIYDANPPGLLVYTCGADALEIGVMPPSNETVTVRALRCVTEPALRDVTLCALLRVWCAVNSHGKTAGTDAIMSPMDLMDLDNIAGFEGFGDAMLAVGWVSNGDGNSLVFPNFLEFNEPACLRHGGKSNAERQRVFRLRHRGIEKAAAPVTESNGSNDREEKRRVRGMNSPKTPTCSEPTGSEPPATGESAEPAVLEFPTVGRGASVWPLTEAKVAEYRESFPGVDVLAECRVAVQWCRDNPTKRKTYRGMAAFLTRWLSQAQDRGGRNGKAIPRDPPPARHPDDEVETGPMDAAKAAAFYGIPLVPGEGDA